MNKEMPARKQLRLKGYDYSNPGAYYLTICTENRRNYFWNGNIDPHKFHWTPVGANCVRPKNLPLSNIGSIVANELEIWNSQYDNVSLYSYVIMPNHLHIMVVILPDESGRTQFAPTVSRMVKQFKGAVTKKIGRSIWQRSCNDHIIRDKKDYEIRSRYIFENPMNWYYDELYSDM